MLVQRKELREGPELLSEWVGPGTTGGYEIFAWPAVADRTGKRGFYLDESGVIRGGALARGVVECGFNDGDDAIEDLFRSLPPLD